MDPLRQLQVKRRPLRGTVDRLTKELDDLVLNGQRNKHAPNLRKNIVSAIKQASEKKNLLQKLDDEVKDLILASNDEDAYDLEYTECEKIMEELSTAIVGGEEFLQSLETTAAASAMPDEGEEGSQKTENEKGDVLQHVTDPAVRQLYVKRRPLRGTVNKIITKLLNIIDDSTSRPNVSEVKKTMSQATEKLRVLVNLDEQIKDTLLSHEQQNIQDLYEAEYEACEAFSESVTDALNKADEFCLEVETKGNNSNSETTGVAQPSLTHQKEVPTTKHTEVLTSPVNTEESSENMVVNEPDVIEEKAKTKNRLADNLLQKSRQVQDSNKNIRIYTPREKAQLAQGDVEKYDIGNKNASLFQEKAIMVLGATGTGKTTFINSMVNYLFEVEAKDPFRFKLITQEDEGGDSAQSVTKKVTAYVLHETKLPYRLIVVDTPGYGDTDGIKADKRTTGLIKKLFESSDESGISRLDAIVLVVKASDTRLTAHQRHNFNSVFQLFGKDLGENIVVVATFSDASDPPVKRTLQDQGISFKSFHKFNNSAFFEGPKNNPREQKAQEFYWDVGQEGFEDFFESLGSMHPKSLSQSAEVLRKREALENYVTELRKHVQSGIANLETMRQEALILEKFESQIQANQGFDYTVQDEKVTTEKTPPGRYTTNCTTCNRTCHDNCVYKDDGDKKGCVAMGSDGKCTICKPKCFWDIHKNQPYIYKVVLVTVKKTHEDLLKKYSQAKGDKTNKEALLNNLAKQFGAKQEEVLDCMRNINAAIDELHKIAHHPRFMTDVEYIENLIEAEKSTMKPGYKERIAHLTFQRDLAETMQKAQDPNFDPFAAYRNGKWSKFIDDFNKKYSQQQRGTASGKDGQKSSWKFWK